MSNPIKHTVPDSTLPTFFGTAVSSWTLSTAPADPWSKVGRYSWTWPMQEKLTVYLKSEGKKSKLNNNAMKGELIKLATSMS